jgi:hypothetical protein
LLNNQAKNSRVVNVLLLSFLVGVFLLMWNVQSLKEYYQSKQADQNRSLIKTHFSVNKSNEYFEMHFENESPKLNDFFEISKPLIEALKYEYTGLEYN